MLARTILPKLLNEAKKPFVSILIGPRQVGKTVLLKAIQKSLGGKSTYLDMENPLDARALTRGVESLLAEIGSEAQILFLDVFYRIPDALGLFKQIRDAHPQIKVYASGSSSIEIHSHLKQSAVGRVRRTRIFPLSFPEWCQQRIELDLAGWDHRGPLPPRKAEVLRGLLGEFAVWGGMPELTQAESEQERREILSEIVKLYLEKDIRGLLKDEAVLHYNELLRHLGIRMTQSINRSFLGRSLGMSERQVRKQLLVMEHTYVLRPVTTDYSNPTKRLVKAPKAFWYDNGVRNALVRDFRPSGERPDGGALLENHVFGELEKACGVDVDILFHRTRDGQEIDFVLERDRRKILVEVKSTVGRPRIPLAVKDLLAREDVLGAVVLSYDLHQHIVHQGKKVLFLPLVLAHRVPSLFKVF